MKWWKKKNKSFKVIYELQYLVEQVLKNDQLICFSLQQISAAAT